MYISSSSVTGLTDLALGAGRDQEWLLVLKFRSVTWMINGKANEDVPSHTFDAHSIIIIGGFQDRLRSADSLRMRTFFSTYQRKRKHISIAYLNKQKTRGIPSRTFDAHSIIVIRDRFSPAGSSRMRSRVSFSAY